MPYSNKGYLYRPYYKKIPLKLFLDYPGLQKSQESLNSQSWDCSSGFIVIYFLSSEVTVFAKVLDTIFIITNSRGDTDNYVNSLTFHRDQEKRVKDLGKTLL